MTRQRLNQIEKRIQKIKQELAAIEDMRPGSLTQQFKDSENQTGSYYQLSYTRNMKSRSEYVAHDSVRKVRRQIASYKRFKTLTEEWIDLGIELCRLKMKLARTP
jgi:hypothetical protein